MSVNNVTPLGPVFTTDRRDRQPDDHPIATTHREDGTKWRQTLWQLLRRDGPKTPKQLASIHYLTTCVAGREEIEPPSSLGGAQRNGPDSHSPTAPGQTFDGPEAA